MNIDESISAFLANGFKLVYEAYQTDDLEIKGDLSKLRDVTRKMNEEIRILSDLGNFKCSKKYMSNERCTDTLNEIMRRAIDTDSELGMKQCFKLGFDVDSVIYGRPIWAEAIRKGVRATNLFIDKGADVEKNISAYDYVYSGALALAVDSYNMEVVDFLCDKNVNTDCFVKNSSGDTIPIIPLISGRGYSDYGSPDTELNLIDKLTNKNKNIINKKISKSGATALHMAAYARNLEVMIGLLDRDADPSIKMNDGRTPMELLFDKDGNYYDADYRNHKKGDHHEDRVLMEERLSKVKEAYNRNRERAKNKVYLNLKDNAKEM